VSFGNYPAMSGKVVAACRSATSKPLIAKLSPNQTDIQENARMCIEAGADGLAVINTVMGMAIDTNTRQPIIGNVRGGLSGPAIKPIALRAVYQVARAVEIPVVGIGGIASIDDCMEFLVAGATAVQIGTANFYNPTVSIEILDALPAALEQLNAGHVSEIVATLDVDA